MLVRQKEAVLPAGFLNPEEDYVSFEAALSELCVSERCGSLVVLTLYLIQSCLPEFEWLMFQKVHETFNRFHPQA